MVSSRRAQSYRWTVYECDFRDAQQWHANTRVGGKKGRAKKKGKTHSYAVKVTVLEISLFAAGTIFELVTVLLECLLQFFGSL